MKNNRIGSLEVSVVGLGGNNFGTDFFGARCDQSGVTRIIYAALDAGVNLIDTAEEYSVTSAIGEGHSEEFIGVALRHRRDEAVIATKFLNSNHDDPEERGASRIVAAAEASLRRLGTDRIDLYQQHQPDPTTPVDEILTALDSLVQAGKVREVGCCNFGAGLIETFGAASDRLAMPSYRSCQAQYSLLEHPPPEDLDGMARAGMSLLAYFPLASGLLTGKYRPGEPPPGDSRLGADGLVSRMLRDGLLARRPPFSPERLATVAALSEFAAERDRSLLELAVSWLASQPIVASVLTGATTPQQIAANARAAAWELTDEDFSLVDDILMREGVTPGS